MKQAGAASAGSAATAELDRVSPKDVPNHPTKARAQVAGRKPSARRRPSSKPADAPPSAEPEGMLPAQPAAAAKVTFAETETETVSVKPHRRSAALVRAQQLSELVVASVGGKPSTSGVDGVPQPQPPPMPPQPQPIQTPQPTPQTSPGAHRAFFKDALLASVYVGIALVLCCQSVICCHSVGVPYLGKRRMRRHDGARPCSGKRGPIQQPGACRGCGARAAPRLFSAANRAADRAAAV
jgi:hypothetical protein